LATVATVIIKTSYYSAIASARTLKPFGVRLQQKIDSRAPLLFYNSFDAGTIFYSRRHIAPYSHTVAEISPPFFLLMWEEDWQQLHNQTGLEILDISEGRGPIGKHRLVLVKSAKLLPTLNGKQDAEVFRHDRDDLTND